MSRITELRQLHQQAEDWKRDWELHDRACRNLFAKLYPALPALLDIAETVTSLRDAGWFADWSPDHNVQTINQALARLEQQ